MKQIEHYGKTYEVREVPMKGDWSVTIERTNHGPIRYWVDARGDKGSDHITTPFANSPEEAVKAWNDMLDPWNYDMEAGQKYSEDTYDSGTSGYVSVTLIFLDDIYNERFVTEAYWHRDAWEDRSGHRWKCRAIAWQPLPEPAEVRE